jgi:glycerophosphoryl diester phosphodiesterase
MIPFRPIPDEGESPYVIAHRGISAKAPENTLASFELATKVYGIDMIELDVRLSKDNVPIVLHDRTLQRTSTGNGPARNYLMEEISSFDAGSWFHKSFSSQHIPSLEEVLLKVGDKLWVDIEIKSDLFRREPIGLLEDRVLDIVCQCEMEEKVLFSSFNHRLLAYIKKKKPSAVTGVLYNFPHDFGRSPSALAKCVDASVFVCAKRELTRRMVIDAHDNDIAVYVYTLNSIGDAQRMLSYKVDGVISNNADDIINVIKSRKN